MSNKTNLSKQQVIDKKHDLYKSIASWPASSRYSTEQKIDAITTYFMCSTLRGTERATGIPHNTLHFWRHNSPWWDTALEHIRAENMDRFDSRTTNIIDSACNEMHDRIKEGDSHVLRDGTIIKKPIGFKDLAIGMAVAFDKRQIARKLPTAITTSTDTHLTVLIDKLATLEKTLEKPAITAEKITESN